MARSDPYTVEADVWPGLSKLAEELGELQQVIGKIMGTGGDGELHWDGTNLRVRLNEELADVRAAIWFVINENVEYHDRFDIGGREAIKLRLYQDWRAEQRQEAST